MHTDTKDHSELLEALESPLLYGGQLAVGLLRGTGKTTIVTLALIVRSRGPQGEEGAHDDSQIDRDESPDSGRLSRSVLLGAVSQGDHQQPARTDMRRRHHQYAMRIPTSQDGR